MTKNIRIENADTSNWPVRVTVQDRVYDAEAGKMTDMWRDTETRQIDHPTAMTQVALTSSRRLIIEERGPDPKPDSA